MGGTGNTTGLVRGEPPKSAQPAEESNPEAKPETPKESTWGDWLWEGAKWIPVAGAAPSAWDAGVAAWNGDYMAAGGHLLDGASAFGGPLTKGGLKGGKLLFKAGKKALAETEEQAAKKAAKKAGGKVRKGPCDHLKKGNPKGKGPYRGGSYGQLKGGGTEAHHMPANSVSPLATSQGPSVQMDPADHARTGSHGSAGLYGQAWRENIGRMLESGDWRGATAQELRDLRDVARQSGDPTKYNEGALEMLKYFKCLEEHGLLPDKK